MKVGLLQLNSTIGDFAGNVTKLVTAYRCACAQGAEFVIAPETFLCGYPARDLLLRTDFVEANLAALTQTAKQIGPVPLCVGYVDKNTSTSGRPLHNSAAVLHEGKIVWRQHKTLLPSYDVFEEDRYFEPADSVKLFNFANHRLGITICEDIWNDEDFWPQRLYRRDPVKELISQGADIIINISASPWHLGKEKTRFAMLKRIAKDERVPVVQVNLVGGNDELIFDGNSVVINSRGDVVAVCKSFAEDVIVADVNAQPAHEQLQWQAIEQQLFNALQLGLRDYVQKCGFSSVVIGLSGGIDSALTAVLAVNALGQENVLGVSMPGPYSTMASRADAEQLAKNLGIKLESVPITPAFDTLIQQLAGVFAGRAHDVTEENIQARLRGLILMALSNKFGALVLTTGNKSELAVGYCTLYGDMCGALAVIGDLFKTQVYRLARWINSQWTVIPENSLRKPPSAELRPNQTDQDSLPPYETLDGILELYLERNMSKDEIIQLGFDPVVVNDVINKVTFSEFKRRQAAPVLKVSPRAFGMGRRIPIAQRFRTSLSMKHQP